MIAISPTLPRRTSSITCATLVHARSAAIGRDHTARRSKAHEPGKLICTSMRLVLPMVGNALLHTMGGDAVASEPGVAPGAAHVPAALSFGPTSPEKLPATRSHFTPWLQPLTVTDRFLAHCRFHHQSNCDAHTQEGALSDWGGQTQSITSISSLGFSTTCPFTYEQPLHADCVPQACGSGWHACSRCQVLTGTGFRAGTAAYLRVDEFLAGDDVLCGCGSDRLQQACTQHHAPESARPAHRPRLSLPPAHVSEAGGGGGSRCLQSLQTNHNGTY